MKYLKTTLIQFSILAFCYGQSSAFFEFNTSRYARVVSLGNAFTGLADDIETVYYNSAGMANLDYYSVAYTRGQGFAFITNDYVADNIAVLIPVFDRIGKIALSLDRLDYEFDDYSESLFRLHYAKKIFKNLSIGTSINFYHLSADSYTEVSDPGSNDRQFTGNAFDISVSALYSMPVRFIPGIYNESRIGFQMQNLFDTEIHYSNELPSESKYQTFRAGISTIMIPKFPKINSLNPLKVIIVADAVFYGSNYNFDVWQPNYGIEIKIFEILNLRYGRENEEEIKNYYDYSPQHPVSRYGFGVEFPIHKFISEYERLMLSFDYSYSDWDKLDESKPFGISNDLPNRESYSIKLLLQF